MAREVGGLAGAGAVGTDEGRDAGAEVLNMCWNQFWYI